MYQYYSVNILDTLYDKLYTYGNKQTVESSPLLLDIVLSNQPKFDTLLFGSTSRIFVIIK